MNGSESVPFSEFARLCFIMGQAAIQRSKTQSTEIFTKYIDHLRNHGLYSADNGVIMLLLLFPEEDSRRKFGMQETRMCTLLTKILTEMGFGERNASSLSQWAGLATGTNAGRAGCLGEEVRRIMQTYPIEATSKLTIQEVNEFLDELASHSRYTQVSERDISVPKRSQVDILRDLYRGTTPNEASVITQIILKDMRPIVSPLKIIDTTTNLLEKKTVHIPLTVRQALRICHPALPRLYDIYASIPELFYMLEKGSSPQVEPVVGIPVQIPKCRKGQSCKDALAAFSSSKNIYCETKYDGERMQIHIDLTLPLDKQITIFSKSKRDSTLDRFATLEIIRAALGAPEASIRHPLLARRVLETELTQRFRRSIILEAEMVAFSEKSGLVDEFWRIRDLIAVTAQGVRRRAPGRRTTRSGGETSRKRDSWESSLESSTMSTSDGYSLESNGSEDGDRHFQIVFFDVLAIDGVGLLNEPYSSRRRLLRDTINVITGFAILASRTPLDVAKGDPCRALEAILSSSISQFEEGLVLKAEEGTYNSRISPWVKLKRDYIPGVYDCIDMVVIGAAWDKERARELDVGTDTFTTFYVVALSQPPEKSREKPAFECLFTVSYGLSKEQLERLNFDIKVKLPITYNSKAPTSLSYTFNLCPGLSPPTVLLRKPMLFELFGAGFDKPKGSRYYAIRWPRVSKVYRTEERSWTDGETLQSYNAKAYAAVGRDPSGKWSTIQVAKMWNVSPEVSPIARSVVKSKALEFDCLSRLRKRETKVVHIVSAQVKITNSGNPNPESLRRPDVDDVDSTSHIMSGHFPDPLELLGGQEMAYNSDNDELPRKRRKLEVLTSSKDEHPEQPESGVAGNQQKNTEESSIWRITRVKQPGIVFSSVKFAPLPEMPSISMGSPTSSPPTSPPVIEANLKEAETKESPFTMETLLTNSFILVHRPLYPAPPTRPKGNPALRQILPGERLVSTLEALLVGVSWTPRRGPLSRDIRRGVVFVDPADTSNVIKELEERLERVKANRKELAKIFLVSRSSLDYGEFDLSTSVDILWQSH